MENSTAPSKMTLPAQIIAIWGNASMQASLWLILLPVVAAWCYLGQYDLYYTRMYLHGYRITEAEGLQYWKSGRDSRGQTLYVNRVRLVDENRLCTSKPSADGYLEPGARMLVVYKSTSPSVCWNHVTVGSQSVDRFPLWPIPLFGIVSCLGVLGFVVALFRNCRNVGLLKHGERSPARLVDTKRRGPETQEGNRLYDLTFEYSAGGGTHRIKTTLIQETLRDWDHEKTAVYDPRNPKRALLLECTTGATYINHHGCEVRQTWNTARLSLIVPVLTAGCVALFARYLVLNLR